MVDFTVFLLLKMHKIHLAPKIFWGSAPDPNIELRQLRAVHCDSKQVHQGPPSHCSGFCLIFHFFVSEMCLNSLLG